MKVFIISQEKSQKMNLQIGLIVSYQDVYFAHLNLSAVYKIVICTL